MARSAAGTSALAATIMLQVVKTQIELIKRDEQLQLPLVLQGRPVPTQLRRGVLRDGGELVGRVGVVGRCHGLRY